MSSDVSPSQGLVSCPICQKLFPLPQIESHAATCVESVDQSPRSEQILTDEKLAQLLQEAELDPESEEELEDKRHLRKSGERNTQTGRERSSSQSSNNTYNYGNNLTKKTDELKKVRLPYSLKLPCMYILSSFGASNVISLSRSIFPSSFIVLFVVVWNSLYFIQEEFVTLMYL